MRGQSRGAGWGGAGWAWGTPRTGEAGQEWPRGPRPPRGAEGSGGGRREGYSQITTSSRPSHAGKPRGTGPQGGIKGDSKPVSRHQGQQSRRGSPAPPALSEQETAAWLPDRLPWRRTACPGVGPQGNRLWLFRRDLLAHRGSWRGKTNRLTWPGKSR